MSSRPFRSTSSRRSYILCGKCSGFHSICPPTVEVFKWLARNDCWSCCDSCCRKSFLELRTVRSSNESYVNPFIPRGRASILKMKDWLLYLESLLLIVCFWLYMNTVFELCDCYQRRFHLNSGSGMYSCCKKCGRVSRLKKNTSSSDGSASVHTFFILRNKW